MYSERTDRKSGRSTPETTKTPTQIGGTATVLTKGAGRATAWEAMQSEQFCREGPEVE